MQKNKFYEERMIEDGSIRRVYDARIANTFDLIYSEFSFFLNRQIARGTKLYLLSNLNVNDQNYKLDEVSLKYLSQTLEELFEEPLDYKRPQPIVDIKNAQYNDFIKLNSFFLKLNNQLNFWFLIPRKTNNNFYYYDLLIALNNGDINDFIKLKLNLIRFDIITPLFNITHEFLQKIFQLQTNFEQRIFYNSRRTTAEDNFCSKQDEFLHSEERLNLNNFLKLKREKHQQTGIYVDLDEFPEYKILLEKEENKRKSLFNKKLYNKIFYSFIYYHFVCYDMSIRQVNQDSLPQPFLFDDEDYFCDNLQDLYLEAGAGATIQKTEEGYKGVAIHYKYPIFEFTDNGFDDPIIVDHVVDFKEMVELGEFVELDELKK